MGYLSYENFSTRALAIRKRMETACMRAGRCNADVRLLPVTKTHGPWAVEYSYKYGLPAVGENRVQEAVEKRALCGGLAIRWELIGTLQSNKARLAVAHFSRIQSVDRVKLVGVLQRQCEEQGREKLPVLLQVNAGNDPAKHGADPADADALLEAALSAPRLEVQGLMTIAPLDADPGATRRTFATLHEIRNRLESAFSVRLPELSMGMSGDMETAIEEGSTLVRVGSALFGERA